MEIRKGIDDPIRGERVVAVDPPFVPDGQTGWNRRLNLYTGRSLSATALETEQRGRAGRLTTRAQSASHGVVTGLEIGLEMPAGAGDGLPPAFLTIAPGYGVAASGDDVLIPAARRIPVAGISISGVDLPGDAATFGALFSTGALDGIAPAGVLRLRPVILPAAGEFDEFDACVDEEADAAFEDQQLADAALLEYVPLTPAVFHRAVPQPAGVTAAAINRWRNEIAYAIFALDAETVPPAVLPWEEEGVAIGVLGFGPGWRPVFVDRASVVRAGGKPRRRSRLQPARGSAFLWQARLEQLAEQVAQLQFEGTPTDEIGAMMRFLPPAGIIPADALEFGSAAPQNRFFPARFGVDAVPIPLDQLDVAFEASAALDPYNTFYTDYVRLLVPVPGHLYEPRLLQQEAIDPIFEQTIASFRTRRDTLLGRRLVVRAIYRAYRKAIEGKAPEFPDDATLGRRSARRAAVRPARAGLRHPAGRRWPAPDSRPRPAGPGPGQPAARRQRQQRRRAEPAARRVAGVHQAAEADGRHGGRQHRPRLPARADRHLPGPPARHGKGRCVQAGNLARPGRHRVRGGELLRHPAGTARLPDGRQGPGDRT